MLRLIILAVIILGCAKPTTHRPTVSLPELSEEITLQAREEFRQHMERYERVQRIADPLLLAATDFCPETNEEYGFYYFDKQTLEPITPTDQALLLDYYGLETPGNYPFITYVRQGSGAEESGLKKSDRIIQFDDKQVDPRIKVYKKENRFGYVTNNKNIWVQTLSDVLYKTLKGNRHGNRQWTPKEQVSVKVLRRVPYDSFHRTDQPDIPAMRDTTLELFLSYKKICASQIIPVQSGRINAYTDGKNIGVTKGMLKFASDEELALIIAHELAHIIEKHIDKKQTNSLLGTFIGGMVDELLHQGLGIYTWYGNRGAQIGAVAFSQEFELEADYVALYILARAGYSTENAADFWRKVAERSPLDSNSLTGTHPPTAQRYLLLSKTHAEIEKKKAEGQPLLPNRIRAEE